MKLSQYIKQLKEFKKQYGDFEVIYSSDDEGNCFSPILFAPTPVRVEKISGHMQSEELIFDTVDFNTIIIN